MKKRVISLMFVVLLVSVAGCHPADKGPQARQGIVSGMSDLVVTPTGGVHIVTPHTGNHSRRTIFCALNLCQPARQAEAEWLSAELQKDPVKWGLGGPDVTIVFWGTWRVTSDGKTEYPRLCFDGTTWILEWADQESVSSSRERFAILH